MTKPSADESSGIKLGRSKLCLCIQIFAVVTVIMGIYFARKFLVPSFQRPTTQWIITGKTTGPTGEDDYLEFHAPEYPGPDGRQTRPFPDWFCNAAWSGDVMLMDLGSSPTSGYILLLRNGRVIARLFNAKQKQGLWFAAIAIFPVLALYPWKNQRIRLAVLSLACTAEIIVIVIALVVALFYFALVFGGGSFG